MLEQCLVHVGRTTDQKYKVVSFAMALIPQAPIVFPFLGGKKEVLITFVLSLSTALLLCDLTFSAETFYGLGIRCNLGYFCVII